MAPANGISWLVPLTPPQTVWAPKLPIITLSPVCSSSSARVGYPQSLFNNRHHTQKGPLLRNLCVWQSTNHIYVFQSIIRPGYKGEIEVETILIMGIVRSCYTQCTVHGSVWLDHVIHSVPPYMRVCIMVCCRWYDRYGSSWRRCSSSRCWYRRSYRCCDSW